MEEEEEKGEEKEKKKQKKRIREGEGSGEGEYIKEEQNERVFFFVGETGDEFLCACVFDKLSFPAWGFLLSKGEENPHTPENSPT